jgi:hypothetical protein
VTPGSNSSTVLSANDLNPRSVSDLRNTRGIVATGSRRSAAKRPDYTWQAEQ